MAAEGTRDAYGRAIVELAREHKNVYAMDCDLGRSTRAYRITEADPQRFIEMGIAEQDMMSTAAGMASMGKVVFVNSFAVFLTGRAYDQIRQQVSLPGMNVKICASSSGITQGPDGATHQSVTDMNLMRGLPNMAVLSPADGRQTEEMVRFAYEYNGPVYIRLSRYLTPPLVPEGLSFELGKAQTLAEGTDVAIISTGPVLKNVLEAVPLLEERGLSCGIYNIPTIKPIDTGILQSLAARYPLIVSVEEHSIIGGLGTAIAETLAEMDKETCKARLFRLGVKDCYGESGSAEELLARHGLDAKGITKGILENTAKSGRKR